MRVSDERLAEIEARCGIFFMPAREQEVAALVADLRDHRALLREIAALRRHQHYTLMPPELLAQIDALLEEQP